MEKIIQQIKLYKESGEKYKQVDHEYYEQKAYYILYLKRCLSKLSVENSIELLEKILKDYVSEKETTEARKFLQPKFRKEIDGKIEELGGTIKGSLIKYSQRKEKKQTKQKVSESKVVYTENNHQQDKDVRILEYYENFKKILIKQFPNIIIEPKKTLYRF